MSTEPEIVRRMRRRRLTNAIAISCNIGLIIAIGYLELRTGRWAPDPSTLAPWPLLAEMSASGLDLILFAVAGGVCVALYLIASGYTRLFPTLDRSGDMWDRSAQRPRVTALRLAVQTVAYLVVALAVAAFLASGLIVTIVRFNPVVAALFVNLCFVFLPVAIVSAYKGGKRAARGLEADSDLRPDASGRPRAHRLAELTQAAPAQPGTMLPTRRALENVRIAAGLAVEPLLLRVPGHGLNAFVDGIGEHMVIGVTSSFAEQLTEVEQQAAFASLVSRGLGTMPDVFAQQSASFAPSSRDAFLGRVTQVYLRSDHAGIMLTRSPEPMIAALSRAIAAPQGTFIDGLYGNYASQTWVTPVDTNWLVPGTEDEATRVAVLAGRPEYERIRALKEVVGAAGVAGS